LGPQLAPVAQQVIVRIDEQQSGRFAVKLLSAKILSQSHVVRGPEPP
jgi:hypothetical protein